MANGGQKREAKKSLQWRLEYLAYAATEGITLLFPLSWVFRAGELIGRLGWHIMPKRRRTIIRNLRVVFAGEKSIDEIERMAKESFSRSMGNLISAARTARLSPDKLGKIMRIKNPELMENALLEKRGVVMQLAHMGNWELLSRLIHLLPKGTKIGGFYRPLNNPLLDQRVLKRREADGSRMFSKRDNPLHVASFLKEGGIVGILADQRVGIRGEVTTYFGRITRASPLPSLLARRSRSAVVSLAVTTVAPGRWELEFIPVDSPASTENCMRSLERVIRTSPIDVFWLQDRWKMALTDKAKPSRWLGSEDRTGAKHHRMLVWLLGHAKDWKPDDTWRHPDVIAEFAVGRGSAQPDWIEDGAIVHQVDPEADSNALDEVISAIDLTQVIPLDFILTSKAPKALVSAARRHSIQVISAESPKTQPQGPTPPGTRRKGLRPNRRDSKAQS